MRRVFRQTQIIAVLHTSDNALVLFFAAGNIRDRPDHILQLLDMHCGSDQTGLPQSSSGAGGGAATTSSGTNSLSVAAAVVTEVTEGGSAGVSVETNMGYLVLMKCEFCAEASLKWSGDTIHVKPTAETTISLSQIEVSYVAPLVTFTLGAVIAIAILSTFTTAFHPHATCSERILNNITMHSMCTCHN